MALVVKRLTQHIAAEIRGVDLSAPVSEADFQEIQRAFDEHSILVFPDQDITDDQQVAFSQRFGPLETYREFESAWGGYRGDDSVQFG